MGNLKSLPCTEIQQAGEPPADLSGFIFNIMHYCLHDGPGIRTTVFFKGCPLACWWCHNPESRSCRPNLMYLEDRCMDCGGCVEVCPNGAIRRVGGTVVTTSECQFCGTCVETCPAEARQLVGRRMTVSAVIREIEKDLVFWEESGGGVTFSGGEPLAQPEFLDALLDACLERRIHTVVDTCGMAKKEALLHLADKVSMFLYDLKLLDPIKHKVYTGVSNDSILENLELLAERGRPVTIRYPIIPGINDSDENVREMADFLSRLGLWRINLLPYHRTGTEKYSRLGLPYRLEGLEPPPANHVQRIALSFAQRGFTVRNGG